MSAAEILIPLLVIIAVVAYIWLRLRDYRFRTREPDGTLSDRDQLLTILHIIVRTVGDRQSNQPVVEHFVRALADQRTDLGGTDHIRHQLEELKEQGMIRLLKGPPEKIKLNQKGREHADRNALWTDPKPKQPQTPRQTFNIKDSSGVTIAGGDATSSFVGGDFVTGHKVKGDVHGWTPERKNQLVEQLQGLALHLDSIPDDESRHKAWSEHQRALAAVESQDASRLQSALSSLREVAKGVVPNAVWDGLKALVLLVL